MEKNGALQRAARVARLIRRGQHMLSRTAVKDLPLLALLPLFSMKEKGVEIIDPTIEDILLFGSAARGDSTVGDIDMMIIDRGFYSTFFGRKSGEAGLDWYLSLTNNLEMLLTGWFGLRREDAEVQEVLGTTKVDLHVLPVDLFRSPEKRAEIAGLHSDSSFFRNALSDVRRFEGGEFIPTNLSYFEEKFNTSLADLRSH